MINSVPVKAINNGRYDPMRISTYNQKMRKDSREDKNIVKIDNYEGRRFKTQQGYSPMMTKSRYDGIPMDSDDEVLGTEDALDDNIYRSSENIVLRRNRKNHPFEKKH